MEKTLLKETQVVFRLKQLNESTIKDRPNDPQRL